jgi:NAD(P)-dependent dehydrogenase (short-subunit alcohol dehydrogenase family)
MKAFSLEHRRALVTGSSQGIGEAIADGLVEAGAEVVRHGRETRPADLPAETRYLCADLLDPETPARLIEAAGPLELLVCNAGSFFDLPALEMTRERWQRTFQLNVEASFFLVQAFARACAAEGRGGSIVLTASTNGFQAEADSCAYDASKGALVMLVRTLAVSLAPLGIRVNGIAPGLIRTPLTSQWLEPRAHDLVKHYEQKILLGEVGRPADCAGAVVYLCSDAARYVTGEILVIDGGLTVGQIGRMPG